ncbi:MAG: phosphatidylserine decarboxylase [Acidobacteria bacterium]|nr:phosphatidylserine decarboxylase [Acidobacteriota bacterium]
MARDAYPYVLIPAVLALGCFYLELPIVAVTLLGSAGFMAFFFRDPEREIPEDEMAVVSPADGKIVGVVKLDPTDPASPTRLSIFLSVFDVHINRAPIAGQIKDVAFQPGRFRAAFAEAASVVNEQSIITMEGNRIRLVFKQIAGLLARRIVFSKRPGDWVAKGERVGLIKFGSRTDVILPPEVEVSVRKGEKVYGGSSIIGRIRS